MAARPQKLGKYEIRGELGRGAMGIVYAGWDPGIGRRVALKTVRREQLESGESAELLSRFKREAQAAGRLSHPGVVAVYEYGEDDGTAFIAMEHVDGRELKDCFDRNERFPLPAVVRMMCELLEAIAHAHANGIVHRDIKPANVFLLADGRVKVGDFGIARLESSNLTQAGSVLGTPAYMSPEQFMGQTVDGRSDLFSAGVILYQFLTGEKPFTGQLTTIMHKVLKEDPIAPSELNVQVPAAFDALVRKAMAKRPDDRFRDAAAFIAALRGAAATIGAGTGDDATLTVGVAGTMAVRPDRQATTSALRPPAARDSAATSGKMPTDAPAAAAPPRKTPGMALAIVGGSLLAAVALIAWLWLRGSGSPSAAAIAPAALSVAPATVAPPAAPATASANGIVITAVGFADPSDPRFSGNPGLLASELRDDARRQLIEKALALYVQRQSLAEHYELVRGKLLSRSNEFIAAVLQEDPPRTGKDGLASVVTRARVNVRLVQQTLNQMSRDERIEFIRNNGDPKISVTISTRPEDGPATRSPVAENILKERIQSFGFRTWSEDGDTGEKGADFAVSGEAKFRKLSAKLAASGITVEKTVLGSWTVKAVDKTSGEEIYFSTQIPERTSWANEDLALRDVGKLIGDEFSRGFFLSHFNFGGQPLRLRFSGLPEGGTAMAQIQREVSGLRNVLDLRPAGPAAFDAELAGGGNPADLVLVSIVQPLNAKFGRHCFALAGIGSGEIGIAFDPACTDAATLGRLDTSPPAALYEAPPARRKAVIRNEETLRSLSI